MVMKKMQKTPRKNIQHNRKKIRRVVFVITSFIHYSRSLLVLDELKKRKDVDLHIVIGGTALLSKYSSKYAHILELLEESGFKNLYELHFNLEGDDHVVKAKTVGVGVVEFSTLFNSIKPDVLVVRGDRFEVLSAVIAAVNMNIVVAHIEGGDLSGTLDESVRHAITKLSHIHFTTNEMAKKRVLKMGEDPKYVFNFGSPDIEVAQKIASGNHKADFTKTGSGAKVDFESPFIMVMLHPVTTDDDSTGILVKEVLSAVYKLDMQTVWFWPNFDAGAEKISHALRAFNDAVLGHKIHFMRYLPPKDFIWLLSRTVCLVGNSSAGVKECSYLGVPVVNIGTRQSGRLRAENLVDIYKVRAEDIKTAILKQVNHGKYPISKIYKGSDTALKIAKVVATIPLYIQKKFYDR